jgi:putative membrane protein
MPVRFIFRLLITALTIFGVAYLSSGRLMAVAAFWPTAVIAAFVLGLVNAVVKPVVKLLTLPITCLTLGIFLLVINAGMLYLVDWIVPGFETVGFLPTVLASVLIAIVSGIGSKLVDGDDKRRERD